MKNQLFILFFILSHFLYVSAQTDASIIGKWINEDQTQVVQVSKDGEKYQAKLLHLNIENATLLLDSKNDKEELRNRKVIGAKVWSGFEYLKEKEMWKYGEIYNYKTGNYYTGKIHLEEDVLKLTGYYGFFFFLAKTQKWTRVVE